MQLQLTLPEMIPSNQLEYWCGYTFGMPLGDQWKWCAGVVTTPRYSKLVRRECRGLPVMMDNGAFSAWRNGVDLEYDDHMASVLDGIEVLGRIPERVVLPDIVSGGKSSLERSLRSIERLAQVCGRQRLWLPVQEGIDVEVALEAAHDLGGIFVGGATKGYKLDVAKHIRWINKTIPIHIGRLSKPHELAQAVYVGASSFDTTTYMRQQNANKKIKWHDRFRLCVEQKIMGDVVILLSGGPDSVSLLEYCKREGLSVACALWVDYGQRARLREYEHAQAAADFYGVRLEVRKFGLGLGDMGEGIGAQVVPVRNAVLCSIASNLAASCGAGHVMIGCVLEDAGAYIDCTERYLTALNELTRPFNVRVCAPWINEHKAVALAGVPESLDTWSCYMGGDEPCGECAACKARLKAQVDLSV